MIFHNFFAKYAQDMRGNEKMAHVRKPDPSRGWRELDKCWFLW